MTTMESAHRAAGSMPQPYPSLPASPTLTNPDMILPDYDRSSSPVDLNDPDLRSQSPMTMWKNAHAASTDLQHMFNTTPSQQLHAFTAGPVTPTTPIIYGNGTMLSDIGEVTEVESTVGKPSPSRGLLRRESSRHTMINTGDRGSGSGSDRDSVLRVSPTTGYKSGLGAIKKRAKESAAQRERRSSIDSDSTITTQDQAGLFADFDDAISVGDSVFQGDDEESLASSYVPDHGPVFDHNQSERIASGGGGGVAGNDTNRYSTASLSRRAEEILANAKRRLTTMEGNLNRARSSLHVRSTSPRDSDDASTPSPPMVRAATALNLSTEPSSSNSSPGHSRGGSDNPLRIGLPVNVYPQRAASALGAAGGYRQPLAGSKSMGHLQGPYARPSYKSPSIEMALEPLSEDDVVSPALTSNDNSDDRLSNRDSLLGPAISAYGERGLTRSASVAQMRDLKDQVKDLKGKISSLREQARVDSLKRRSLQSLRTPSPFTHAQIDQWYAEPTASKAPGSGSGGDGSTGRNPWDGEHFSEDGDGGLKGAGAEEARAVAADGEGSTSDYEEPGTPISHLSLNSQGPAERHLESAIAEEAEEEDLDDLQTENGDMEESDDGGEAAALDDDDYQSESGDSLYHDSVQQQVSHEDREDAFDYEHFFLHSAMGTISQQRLARRGSRDSFSSDDSVATARGPITSDMLSETSPRSRPRSDSVASTSTMDSFATADEGRASRHGGRAQSSTTDDTAEDYPGQFASLPARSESPMTARRFGFGSAALAHGQRSSLDEKRTSQPSALPSPMRRPMSTSAAMVHRPSVSSFESTGTNRSFPLISKAKKASSAGVLTPDETSPDQELRAISETLMKGTAGACLPGRNDGEFAISSGGRKHSGSLDSATGVGVFKGDGGNAAALQNLLREDQYLVERLVATLGRCVLGLTESGRASSESRMYRRRIDAARRILEGLESV